MLDGKALNGQQVAKETGYGLRWTRWLLARGWTVKRWKAQGGYANVRQDVDDETQGAANRHREALFFSPHCLSKARPGIGRQGMIA